MAGVNEIEGGCILGRGCVIDIFTYWICLGSVKIAQESPKMLLDLSMGDPGVIQEFSCKMLKFWMT